MCFFFRFTLLASIFFLLLKHPGNGSKFGSFTETPSRSINLLFTFELFLLLLRIGLLFQFAFHFFLLLLEFFGSASLELLQLHRCVQLSISLVKFGLDLLEIVGSCLGCGFLRIILITVFTILGLLDGFLDEFLWFFEFTLIAFQLFLAFLSFGTFLSLLSSRHFFLSFGKLRFFFLKIAGLHTQCTRCLILITGHLTTRLCLCVCFLVISQSHTLAFAFWLHETVISRRPGSHTLVYIHTFSTYFRCWFFSLIGHGHFFFSITALFLSYRSLHFLQSR